MEKTKFKKMFHFRFLLLIIAGLMMGQSALAFTASGIVRDAFGILPGASVTIVGQPGGVMTGSDGRFSIEVPAAGTMLQFSFIGLDTQTLPAAANMTVELGGVVELTTVVAQATGIGAVDRVYGTHSGTFLGREDLTTAGVITSAEQMLAGRVAGLTVVQSSGDPSAGSMMRLRGQSSLSGASSPLIVVDGVAGVDINTIPAADILSIDVLKDAAAVAIYGSRAAAGVILITTNRRDIESRGATYTGSFGVAQAANRLNLLTANDWISQERPSQFLFGGDTDWQDAIMRTAHTHSHTLSFHNISQSGGFRGSVSYMNTEGVVRTSGLERIGAALTGFTNVLDDRVTLELSVNKSQDNFRSVSGPEDYNNDPLREIFMRTYIANPTWPIHDPDRPDNLFLAPATRYNPLNSLYNHLNNVTRNRLMAYLRAEIWFLRSQARPNDGLRGTITLSHNSTETQNRRFTYTHAHEDNLLMAGTRGRAHRGFSSYSQQQLEMFLNYDWTFDHVHRVGLLAGHSFTQDGTEGFGVGVRGFDFDHFRYHNLAGAKNLVALPGPGDDPADFDFRRTGATYSFSHKDESSLASFFGRVNYSFMGRYMFNATLRADGSSRFGVNNRWGVFPAVSLGWRISQENFMAGTSDWLDDLRLRASYGITGNQGGIQPYMSTLTYVPTDQLGHPIIDDDGELVRVPWLVYRPERNANPDLRWESTAQFNVGLDFSLWNSRLTGTFEAYNRATSDLLYFIYVGPVAPVPHTLMNIGSLRNRGVELSLSGVVMQRNNFSWMANLNLSHNNNTFMGFVDDEMMDRVDLNMGIIQGPTGPFDGLASENFSQRLRPGYSIGSFFGARTSGFNEAGELLFIRNDGTLTTDFDVLDPEEKDHFLGSAMPRLNVGFGMNFNYGRFDLGIQAHGAFGQKVFNATAMVLSEFATDLERNSLASAAGKNVNNAISDHWLENASFLRIQNITLGYNFNVENWSGINALRLHATVTNPIVFTNYSGIDPEVSLDINITEREERRKRSPGIDNFDNFPRPRTFLVGVNVQF